MSIPRSIPPLEVLKELDKEYFRDRPKRKYFTYVKEVLQTLQKRMEYDKILEKAVVCLYGFWAHYSREHIARVLKDFAKVEKALYGLELSEERAERYRDHFLHMFNVFLFGSRVLSALTRDVEVKKKIDANLIEKLFKIRKEPKDTPFKPYNSKQRLFFLWTLISTFHDVGIPIEHMERMRKGLDSFVTHFGFRVQEIPLVSEAVIALRLERYLNQMSRMFDSGIAPTDDGIYNLSNQVDPYFYNSLVRAFNEKNHGIISALCLYKSIEETFLVGKHEDQKLDLTPDGVKSYVRLVFEHDITRAALAITLHNLDYHNFPKIFPISFEKFPLAYLLILCDELGEYYRLEGISLSGVVPLVVMPELKINLDQNNRINIDVTFVYKEPKEKNRQKLLDQAQRYRRLRNEPEPKTLEEHITHTWNEKYDKLEHRLSFPPDGSISVKVFVNWQSRGGDYKLLRSWRKP